MSAGSKDLRILEVGLLFLGLVLLAMFAFAHIHRFITFRAEVANFEARQLESAKGSAAGIEEIDGANRNADLHQARGTEYSPLGNQHTRLHQATLGKPVQSLAVLRIPALHLEVPVLEGTDEVTLNSGVGRIANTALPGQRGNIGIAGHLFIAGILAGVGLLKLWAWCRRLALLRSVGNLSILPFGTIVGLSTILTLPSKQGRALLLPAAWNRS